MESNFFLSVENLLSRSQRFRICEKLKDPKYSVLCGWTIKKCAIDPEKRRTVKRRALSLPLSPFSLRTSCAHWRGYAIEIKCRCKWRLASRRGINSRRMSGILLPVTFPWTCNQAVPHAGQPLPYEDPRFLARKRRPVHT